MDAFAAGPSPATAVLPAWLNGIAIVGAALGLLGVERGWPLRRETESKARRDLRNVAMAALSAATIAAVERPLALPLAWLVEARGWGVVKWLRLPPIIEVALGVVLLDYTLFVWHVLTHKVPLLWRLHQVHHADLDLDASTALRFHCVEMAASVPWRAAQIVVIGVSPLTLSLWQTATLVAILFHHSNVRLPIAVERVLCRIVMTPRMHGIHHSIVREETDSNWSTIFTWPDYLHGTARLDVPQQAVTIGVPAYRASAELTFARLLVMPIVARRPTWLLPSGTRPRREPQPTRDPTLAA